MAVAQEDRSPAVVVVDDHALFVSGLVRLLTERGVTVVGAARSGEEALEAVGRLRPDVVLMDLSLPGMSGVEATRRLTRAHAGVCVVMLTVIADEAMLMEAIQAGAVGYLLKDAPIEQIVAAVQTATSGGSLLAPELAGKLLRRIRRGGNEPEGPRPPLTDREHEVLELVVEGYDNAAIAKALYISQNTVKNHVSAILFKLEVDNRVQAAVRAVRDLI
jgi:DNA-binding NarL/FixJ family response regulator